MTAQLERNSKIAGTLISIGAVIVGLLAWFFSLGANIDTNKTQIRNNKAGISEIVMTMKEDRSINMQRQDRYRDKRAQLDRELTKSISNLAIEVKVLADRQGRHQKEN